MVQWPSHVKPRAGLSMRNALIAVALICVASAQADLRV